ncbi:putative peptidoglycan lipid II flippase [Desulfonatronum thiosulfatophilum]|uniref:Probable lipid II flippase MurJ n=1 Tax=Desulfonatronum thiosulfatophilum TaxID=617002 RepID=A0A1G6DCE0_9BACT|nr:murein biosynthesis integral membrane protein MurJ [Desulfonatronum thiosulfatophilum]SDB42827.1 putative peptidoglycan lipid II flippase [Desulfonatronum thiosulfatophilum]
MTEPAASPAPTPTGRIARHASVVAAGTTASRILGFLRDMTIAFTLGAGIWADAFFVAFRLPNLLRRLFAEGSLTMAFIPVFSRTRQEKGLAEAFTLARSVLIWLVLILLVICALAIIWAEPLTKLIAPGFARDPEILAGTVTLVRICFPYILFISAVALCMGVLNSLGHFWAPAVAPCVLNIGLIISALLAMFMGWDVALAMAWGVCLSGLGQWMLQQPYLRRYGLSWRGPVVMNHPGAKRIGILMAPTVFGAAVYQVNILIGTLLASLLATGSISYLYYADRLVQLPLGIFAVALSTAALPSMSMLAAANDMTGFRHTLNTTLSMTLFICLPAAAGLAGMSFPIIDAVFGRGAFGEEAVRATAWALVGYSSGLPAFACVRPLISAFYAMEDTRSPVLVAAICLAVNVALSLILMQYMAHVGLAVAAALSSWANVLLLGIILRRKIGAWLDIGPQTFRMTLLSAGLGLSALAASTLGKTALLCIPILACLYALTALKWNIAEARMTRDLLFTLRQKYRR